jgi:hypothetical protein
MGLPSPMFRRHIAFVLQGRVFIVVPLLIGCSGASISLPRAADILIQGQQPVSSRQRNVLHRDEVDSAIKKGFAYFLQNVDLTALCVDSGQEARPCSKDDLGQKRFVGFQITAMRPASEWLSFDFSPGDVITSVNGVSVEHYDAVLPLFEGLANASEFSVSLIRGAEKLTVVIRIDPPKVALSAPQQASGENSAQKGR